MLCDEVPRQLEGTRACWGFPFGEGYRGGSREGEFLSEEEQRAIARVQSDRSLNLAQSIYNAFLNGDWKRQCFYKPSPERMVQIATLENGITTRDSTAS